MAHPLVCCRSRLASGLLLTACAAFTVACSPASWSRRSAAPIGTAASLNREDPSLGGGGRLLASLIPSGGRPTLVLQEIPSGRRLPIGPLARWPQHRSPSLSRNGRYVAVLVPQGARPLAVVWDRAADRLHRLPLPGELEVQRLHLSPDGRQLVLELWRDGRASLRLFDLSGLLEADLPAGLAVQGGGLEPPAKP